MTSYGQRSGTAKEQQEKQGLGYPQSQEHPVEAALHLTLQRSARGQVPGASLTEVKHPKLLVGRKEHIPHFKIKFKKKIQGKGRDSYPEQTQGTGMLPL